MEGKDLTDGVGVEVMDIESERSEGMGGMGNEGGNGKENVEG